MGGNALKIAVTRRFNSPEFNATVDRILEELQKKDIDCRLILSYEEKETFGDADILLRASTIPNNFKQYLQETFSPTEIVQNGSVYSIDIEELQTDFIICSDKDYDSSFYYYAYNDLGNLLGRIAHKMGFKLGHNGLSIIVKEGDYVIKEVEIEKDWYKILEFLDLDCLRYACGFRTKEEIFEYVASSKFFNKQIYQLDNRNHKSRIRDRKRSTYNEFLDWLSWQENLPNAYLWPSMQEQGGRRLTDEILSYAEDFFPGIVDNVLELYRIRGITVASHAKWNGDILMSRWPYRAKELGNFIAKCKKNISDKALTDEGLHDTILRLTDEELQEVEREANREFVSSRETSMS